MVKSENVLLLGKKIFWNPSIFSNPARGSGQKRSHMLITFYRPENQPIIGADPYRFAPPSPFVLSSTNLSTFFAGNLDNFNFSLASRGPDRGTKNDRSLSTVVPTSGINVRYYQDKCDPYCNIRDLKHGRRMGLRRPTGSGRSELNATANARLAVHMLSRTWKPVVWRPAVNVRKFTRIFTP